MTAGAACVVCGRPVPPGYCPRNGETHCFRHTLLRRRLLKRSLVTALIVGTVLTTINQGDRILGGDITAGVALKIGLTYCVPFCVSTSGALGAMRIDDRERS